MVSDTKPKNFIPKFEVVSCFIEYNGKILLLKRQSNKPQPNKYGVPAGKIDKKETIIGAVIREVKEETGITIPVSSITFYASKFVEYDDLKFIYHMFNYKIDDLPSVTINPIEHQKYLWEYPENCLNLDLIQDEDYCIKDYYRIEVS